jgi:hypothetical protein
MVHHKITQLFLCLAFLLVVSAAANAQATRTWISGVGDDVNPCSRTAPCKTFAGAISKTAKNGEINCLDPGGFGSVTITKSITLDCSVTFGSVLASLTNGIIINITDAADTRKAVRIRGLQINGSANGMNGIRVIAANSVSIENVVIDGFTLSGVSVEGAAQVAVRNSSIRATQTAVNVNPVSGTADATVTGTSLTFNGTGVNAGTNGTARLSGNTIAYNTTGLTATGKIYSFGNNVLDANGTNGTPTSTTPLK